MWSFMRDTAAADVKAAVDLQRNLKRQVAALTMEEDRSSVPGQRVASDNSTLSQSIDSAGDELVCCGVEVATQGMAFELVNRAILHLWQGDIKLSWLPPEKKIVLSWTNGYGDNFGYNRENQFGRYRRVTAIPDGCLRFKLEIPGPDCWWQDQNSCFLLEAKRFKVKKVGVQQPSRKESTYIGQIVAEMLSMVCHTRYRGQDQEAYTRYITLISNKAYVMYVQGRTLQLYHCHFPAEYLNQVKQTGRPENGIQLRRTRQYDMLVRKDCGKFWDLLVALLCNFEARIVKTGYAWKDWPDNSILDERKYDKVDSDNRLSQADTPPPVPDVEGMSESPLSAEDDDDVPYTPTPAPKKRKRHQKIDPLSMMDLTASLGSESTSLKFKRSLDSRENQGPRGTKYQGLGKGHPCRKKGKRS